MNTTTTESKSLESLSILSISNDKEIDKLTKLQNKFNKLDNLYINLDKSNSTNHSTPIKEEKKILNKINIEYKSNNSSFDEEDITISEEFLSEEKRGCCFNCNIF